MYPRSLGLVFTLTLGPLGSVTGQHHAHPAATHHGDLLTIEDVLAMPQNAAARQGHRRNQVAGVSGDGDLTFEVAVTAASLPKKVLDQNPYQKGRTCLDCAHGGFAYDDREGKGEIYWFLQGAGMLRVNRDRSKIDLLATDPKMLAFNMHNATFFVHHGEARIAWPANGGGRVFITDVDGKLIHTIGRPTVGPYADAEPAAYAPTDTAYLDGALWVTDGYASQYVMSYDLDERAWTGAIFGGRNREQPTPGKFGTNHGITIHKGLIYVSGRFFARIHRYRPATEFVNMFPLPDGSKPCDFEFFVVDGKLFGVAASLNTADENRETDKGAAIYIVDMATLKIVSTIKPLDELGLDGFTHIHNVFPTIDDGAVTLFCQAWNGGDFAVLRQTNPR